MAANQSDRQFDQLLDDLVGELAMQTPEIDVPAVADPPGPISKPSAVGDGVAQPDGARHAATDGWSPESAAPRSVWLPVAGVLVGVLAILGAAGYVILGNTGDASANDTAPVKTIESVVEPATPVEPPPVAVPVVVPQPVPIDPPEAQAAAVLPLPEEQAAKTERAPATKKRKRKKRRTRRGKKTKRDSFEDL